MFDQKEYMKEYRQKHKERHIEYRKEYYQKNKDESKERAKQWVKNNPEKRLEIEKHYYENNSGKIKEYQKQYRIENRELINEYFKNRLKTDLKFNLNRKIKNVIRVSLKGNKAGKHWEDIVGYTLIELIKRLQKTIPENYNWQDFIEGRLHIDHVIPISAFNFTIPEHPDFKKCWALKNLRLLPAEENLMKGCKLGKPFQPALKISLIY